MEILKRIVVEINVKTEPYTRMRQIFYTTKSTPEVFNIIKDKFNPMFASVDVASVEELGELI